MEEPEEGIEPETLDMEAHIKSRSNLPYVEYRPIYYKFPDELAPLRSPDKVLVACISGVILK